MVAHVVMALVAAAGIAYAQETTIETSSASSVAATTTLSQAMPPQATSGFNAGLVNDTVRFQWCRAQLNTCPQICGGAAAQNYCQEDDLTYTCVCPNGTSPDVSSFEQTLPFYICQQTYIQCVANAPDNLEAQATCEANRQCGSRNATAEALAATQATAETTATSTTGSGSSETASQTSSQTGASATESGNAAAHAGLSTGAFALLLAAAFKLFV